MTALAAILPLVLAAAPLQASGSQPVAIWSNPQGTVRVRTGRCGQLLCGWIVSADAQAQADAREGGVDQLIGLELLRSYRPTGPNRWQGQVFVPDWNRSFFSRMQALDANRMKISGCILGGLLCKSQIWTRV